ncbi:MAG: ECF transporter S component [Clostridia bacterium]|nr:ECF transporter S component [Clostridia bacterium]
MKQDNKTHTLVLSGVMAAVVMLLTLISIPLPSGSGYVHLGDAAVLLCAALLPLGYAAAAAGVGAALADIILGFSLYAPASLVIKGLMALCCFLMLKLFRGKLSLFAYLVSAALVPLGYLLYETILNLGAAALANIPLNALQGAVGAIIAFAVGMMLSRNGGKKQGGTGE